MVFPLTTLARLKNGYVPITTTQHDAALRSLIVGYSRMVEQFLGRHIERKARTEQYDVDPHVKRWWLRGYPVASSPAAQFRFDTARNFDDNAESSSNYYLRLEDGRVEFEFIFNQTDLRFPGALQAIYTGGMATTLDRLTATITNSGIAADQSVTGGTNGGKGTVVSVSGGTTLVLQVLSGTFQEGETITDDADSSNSATLDSFTAEPLVMSYPTVVEAVNQQVAYIFQRRENLGLSSFSSEGGSITLETMPRLIATVRSLLGLEKRYAESY